LGADARFDLRPRESDTTLPIELKSGDLILFNGREVEHGATVLGDASDWFKEMIEKATVQTREDGSPLFNPEMKFTTTRATRIGVQFRTLSHGSIGKPNQRHEFFELDSEV